MNRVVTDLGRDTRPQATGPIIAFDLGDDERDAGGDLRRRQEQWTCARRPSSP